MPILAMGPFEGGTVLLHRKECTEPECLKTGESQPLGRQGQPGELVMATFVKGKSPDTASFGSGILFQPLAPDRTVLFQRKESPEPQCLRVK